MADYAKLGTEKVLDVFLDGKGLRAISDEAAAAFGNPFWIVDMDSRMLAGISGDTENDRLLLETQSGYTYDETVRYTEEQHVHDVAEDVPVDTPIVFQAYNSDLLIMSAPVMIEKIPVAYVNIINEKHPFRDDDPARLQVIARIVAAELEKSELYRNNKDIMFSYFLSDLLDGRIRYEDVDKRVAVLGYNMKKYCYLLNVALPNTENRRIILRSISSQISSICRNSIGCFYEAHYLYFFTTDRPLEKDSYTLVQLEKFLRETHLKAAISNVFHSAALTRRNYEKTKKALELGMENHREDVLYHYSELVTDEALTLIHTAMSSHDFSDDAVGKLLSYDKAHRMELFPTLRTYLLCACSASAAAVELNVHVNTVRQRLRKIQELTNIDFNAGRQIYEIMTGIALYDMEQGAAKQQD